MYLNKPNALFKSPLVNEISEFLFNRHIFYVT